MDFRDAGRWRNRFREKGKEFGGGFDFEVPEALLGEPSLGHWT